jgi:bis(5'-nucleosidyl)-tetraphosphatase
VRAVTSCGVLVLRDLPAPAFLVLRLYRVHDLPKGRRETGESDLACALRELREETAIAGEDIALIPEHRFTTEYDVRSADGPVRKTLVVFPALLRREVAIRLTEHHAHVWWPWARRADLPGRIVPAIIGQASEALGDPPWARWMA